MLDFEDLTPEDVADWKCKKKENEGALPSVCADNAGRVRPVA